MKTVYNSEHCALCELSKPFITSLQSWVGRDDLRLPAEVWGKRRRTRQEHYESSAGSYNSENDLDSFLHPHS